MEMIESKDKVIKGNNVHIGYRAHHQETTVHQHLDFCLYRGELTCLLGANGSGKSTLLRTLSAIQPALEGDIQLLDRPLTSYSESERSRTIGVVLTERTQAGGLTVYELISLGRQPHTGFFGRLTARDKAIIDHAIQAVGINPLRNKYMAELSDGERQKVFIAKAFVQECPLILLDEPTAFLDVVSRIEIMSLLRRLAKEENKAILLSTHDIDQALVLADRLWLLRAHQGITCGVTEDLILDRQLETLFPESGISFNSMNGVFTPQAVYTRTIKVEAADERLRHWTENALHRIGYLCLSKDMKEGVHPLLKVSSAHELTLQIETETRKFTNFESLLNHLNA